MQQVWIKWSEKCQKNLPNVLAYKKLENKIRNDFLTVISFEVVLLLQTEKQLHQQKRKMNYNKTFQKWMSFF